MSPACYCTDDDPARCDRCRSASGPCPCHATAPSTVTADEARVLLAGAGVSPGPWTVEDDGDIFVEAHGLRIAEVCDIHGPRDDAGRSEATVGIAALMARAPDLARTVVAQAEEIARLREAIEGAHAEALAAHVLLARASESVASWIAERDALRAIIDGRSTPPTNAEIDAHDAGGGRWRWVVTPDGVFRGFSGDLEKWEPSCAVLDARHRAAFYVTRWWPLDATGRPCAWPVTP